jgi:hypothetical protein
MVHRVLQRVLRLGATIATALAGAGSLATAVGFLAERARWNMLGFHSPGADMNEYLFTGARFLAFLPAVFLTAIPDALWLNPGLLVALLVGGGLVLLFRGGRDPDDAESRWGRFHQGVRRRLPRFRLLALSVLVLALLLGTAFLLRATRVVNVLFADTSGLAGFQCGEPTLGLREHVLLQCENQLLAHLGQGFLVVAVGMTALWLLIPGAWRSEGEGGPRQGAEGAPPRGAERAPPQGAEAVPPRGAEAVLFWLAVTLLALQVMLLPMNYGVTYLRTDVPAVVVEAGSLGVEREAWPPGGHFVLLHRRGDEFFLYSAQARRIWLLPRAQIETLVYLGICPVLAPPERCHSGAVPMGGGAP